MTLMSLLHVTECIITMNYIHNYNFHWAEQAWFVFRKQNKYHVYHPNCYSPVNITIILQVLGFAAFFALVLKKVDQEEFGEPQIDESLRYTGKLISRFLICLDCFAQKTPKKTIIFSLRSWHDVCSEKRQHVRPLSATAPHWCREDEKQHD